jgi:N utilization substance protein B
MEQNEALQNPRVIVIQKLYSKNLNFDAEIGFPKHRFKKFIKDVVLGSLERKELIDETIKLHLSEDIDFKRTEKLIIILLQAAIFELLYRPETSVNIIINEYLNVAKAFINNKQKNFLNALLDKISVKLRTSNE